MQLRPALLLPVCLVFLSGGTLFYFKHQLLQVEKQLAQESRALALHEEKLALLKTEWAYLTHPQRIAELAKKYYPDMRPLQKEQVLQRQAL